MAWNFGCKKHWKIWKDSIKLSGFLFSFLFFSLNITGKISEAALSANSWGLSQMRTLKNLWLKMKGMMKIGK